MAIPSIPPAENPTSLVPNPTFFLLQQSPPSHSSYGEWSLGTETLTGSIGSAMLGEGAAGGVVDFLSVFPTLSSFSLTAIT